MTSLLFAISIAALLSITSLLIVLLRVSPILTPGAAFTAFFASTFLSVASLGTLLLFNLWKMLPVHAWDRGQLLSIAIRQGIMLASATIILLLFHLLGLLTWWIAGMIYAIFVLIELAINS